MLLHLNLKATHALGQKELRHCAYSQSWLFVLQVMLKSLGRICIGKGQHQGLLSCGFSALWEALGIDQGGLYQQRSPRSQRIEHLQVLSHPYKHVYFLQNT